MFRTHIIIKGQKWQKTDQYAPKMGPLTPQNPFFCGGVELLITHAKKLHNFALWAEPKMFRIHFRLLRAFWRQKCALLGHFPRSHTKSIFNQAKILWFFQNGIFRFNLLHKQIKPFMQKTPKMDQKAPDPPKPIYWVGEVKILLTQAKKKP